jgi:hypothetical protein
LLGSSVRNHASKNRKLISHLSHTAKVAEAENTQFLIEILAQLPLPGPPFLPRTTVWWMGGSALDLGLISTGSASGSSPWGSRPHAQLRQHVGLRIAGPGLVRAGYAADLVVFDEQQIKPRVPTVEPDLPGVLKGRLAN